MRSDLAHPELFGNEAGEDEDLSILSTYFLEKPDFERFYSSETKLQFVRSRKGVGKSTLLRQTLAHRRQHSAEELVLYLKASDLAAIQDISALSSTELVNAWQQRICTRINRELGAVLQVGMTDDSIVLIEAAEVAGFRSRNIISALFDRLHIKGITNVIERSRTGIAQDQPLLGRILEKEETTVWLLVDDIDATFINTEHERLRTSAFFSACRNLVNSVSGLRIRASVRTDVWTMLASYDESLDKCEQYMLDLRWSTEETGRILRNKIASYFARYYPDNQKYSNLPTERDSRVVLNVAFKQPFFWGGMPLDAFRPIHILSAGRPRWAAQLCKLAGQDAFAKHSDRISLPHITTVLRKYGQFRLADLYKEHRHQCPTLESIVETFAGGPTRYTTQELLDHITTRIIRLRGTPDIDGKPATNGSMSIANFLYRIGFLAGRDQQERRLEFVHHDERPGLLSTTANLDDGLEWEIHPSYRSVLRILNQTASGKQFTHPYSPE